jgi:radical SAM protein with 4Fe4S-binding SPASM domain
MDEVTLRAFNFRLKQKAAERHIPYYASLELTYGCNLRCVHCYNPTHKALPTEQKFPELLKTLEELAKLGCAQIGFTGGEPLTRPDFFDLAKHAKKLGFQVNVLTNATLIDEKKIEELKEAQLNLISVSVYGMTQETYESITRVPGSFSKFEKGRDLLLDSGLPLQFKMPVMTLNVHEREWAENWYHSRKLFFIESFEIHPRVTHDLEPLQYRLPVDEVAKLRHQYDPVEESCRQAASEDSPKLFQCGCGKSSLAITPYGEMNLCVTTHHPKYSISTGSVQEGWKVLVDFVNQAQPSPKYECRSCDLVPYCSQGAMDAWLETGDFNSCIPYFKEVAGNLRSLSSPEKKT